MRKRKLTDDVESRVRSVIARSESLTDTIRAHLTKVPEIDAVYLGEEKKVVHVYSVVEQFHDRIYQRLVKQESLIEKAFPELAFEFHTRAHQGRKPDESVPFDSQLVFSR